MSRVALACGLALLVTGGGCRSAPPSADSRLVTGWMRALYALVRAERLSPPVAARVFAYGAVALYEGLRPGSPQLKSLAGQLNGLHDLPAPRPGERYRSEERRVGKEGRSRRWPEHRYERMWHERAIDT